MAGDAGLVAFLLRRDGDSGDDCAPGDEVNEPRRSLGVIPDQKKSLSPREGYLEESIGGAADGAGAESDGAGDGGGPPLHAAVGAAVSAAKDEVAERVRALLLMSRAGDDDSPRKAGDSLPVPTVDESPATVHHYQPGGDEPVGLPSAPVLTADSLDAAVAPPPEGEAEDAAGEWRNEDGAEEAEAEAEGEWGPRVYMRGFMSLWRGMRGELKQDARAREKRRQGEREVQVEVNNKGEEEAEMSKGEEKKEEDEGAAGMVESFTADADKSTEEAAEMAEGAGNGSHEESVLIESDQGGEAEDEGEGQVQAGEGSNAEETSGEERKKPARASAWALGMLMDWRRQQKQEEQGQPQKQSGGKPVLTAAEEASTAEQATSSAQAAVAVEGQKAELEGVLPQELKAEQGKLGKLGKLGMLEAGTEEDVVGSAGSGVALPGSGAGAGAGAGAAMDAGGKQAAARKAVSCNTCNSCKAFAATAAAGAPAGATSESNVEKSTPAAAAPAAAAAAGAGGKGAVWVQHTADSLRPFLQQASGEELWRVSLLAWLCEKAYSIPRLDVSALATIISLKHFFPCSLFVPFAVC
ncbi:unnamed protein product [Closterium sp. Yama58-4]|nr:unnamed protein product [Closterium sp. Yama58-4]